MRNDVLFLTLKVFSATGGIEKVCRIAGKASYESCTRFNKRLKIYSMHDSQASAVDNPYFPTEIFTGFNVFKFRFMWYAVRQGCTSKVIILSHVNLLPAGWIIKLIKPTAKLVMFAHGIEIWGRMNFMKKIMLKSCDEIVSVSSYTKNKIIEVHGIDEKKCSVINNCLDPYLPLPKNVKAEQGFRHKYGFQPGDRILFTLSRLSAKERYKGYDKVMEALVRINRPEVKYLIAGSYDRTEKEFIDETIARLGLKERVVLAGFIPEEEVAPHFAMSDIYVMPSVKEGFGIVFIEAMYYGLPVIAGNEDGSVDALCNGELGILVKPDSVEEIKNAIEKLLKGEKALMPNRLLLEEHFSYANYKMKINDLLERMKLIRISINE